MTDDAFQREFKLSLETSAELTRDLNLGDEATTLGLLVQPDPEKLGDSTRLRYVLPGWNAVNTPHAGDDIVVTLRNGTPILVNFDGLTENHSLLDVVDRINAAGGASLQARLDVNRIVLRDMTTGPNTLKVERAAPTSQVEVLGESIVELSSRSGELLRLIGQDADDDGILEGGRLFAATLLRHVTPNWDRVHQSIYSSGSLSAPGPDLNVKLKNGAAFNVSWKTFNSSSTLADIVRSIQEAAAVAPPTLVPGSGALVSSVGQIAVEVEDGRIVLRDLSTGGSTFTITGSQLAGLLKLPGSGLPTTVAGSTFSGGLLTQRIDMTATLKLDVAFKMDLSPAALPSARFSSQLQKLEARVDLDPHFRHGLETVRDS